MKPNAHDSSVPESPLKEGAEETRRATRHTHASGSPAAASPSANSTRDLRRIGTSPASARSPAAPAPSPTTKTLGFDHSICKRRVRVWWKAPHRAWFSGKIKEFDAANEMHMVQYDDGDQQWHPLNDPSCQWEFVEADGGDVKKAKRPKPSAAEPAEPSPRRRKRAESPDAATDATEGGTFVVDRLLATRRRSGKAQVPLGSCLTPSAPRAPPLLQPPTGPFHPRLLCC